MVLSPSVWHRVLLRNVSTVQWHVKSGASQADKGRLRLRRCSMQHARGCCMCCATAWSS